MYGEKPYNDGNVNKNNNINDSSVAHQQLYRNNGKDNIHMRHNSEGVSPLTSPRIQRLKKHKTMGNVLGILNNYFGTNRCTTIDIQIF